MLNRKWLILVVGIAIGVLATWGFNSILSPASRGVTPYIVEGYSTGTNFDGTAIGVSKAPGGAGEGYNIAGAYWREFDGPWHSGGTAPSLAQPNTGQKVRLGIVNVKPTQQAPGGPVVAWLEVLSQ
jgi:ABC-type transport system involved in multi-copper enzyme maturation permease subunit